MAQVLKLKYELAQPIHRISSDMSSQLALPVSRQTLAGWVLGAHERWLAMLYDLMKSELLSRGIMHADETTVQVLKEPGRDPSSKSYMWLFASAEREARLVFVFKYDPSRSGDVAVRFLDGWRGYAVTDGYAGYNKLAPAGVRRVPCLVHLRRPFVNLVKDAGGPEAAARAGSVALEAMNRMNRMFAIDSGFDGMAPDERKAGRNELLRPEMDSFIAWARATAPQCVPGMDLRNGLETAISLWPDFERVLEDGSLPLDNNRAERAIRPLAVGRRNWLFSDTQRGAAASAAIYSVVTTAKANGLKVYEYLEWVLGEMPSTAGVEGSPELQKRFLPWSDAVPESCRASGPRLLEEDRPLVDVDPRLLDDHRE